MRGMAEVIVACAVICLIDAVATAQMLKKPAESIVVMLRDPMAQKEMIVIKPELPPRALVCAELLDLEAVRCKTAAEFRVWVRK